MNSFMQSPPCSLTMHLLIYLLSPYHTEQRYVPASATTNPTLHPQPQKVIWGKLFDSEPISSSLGCSEDKEIT